MKTGFWKYRPSDWTLIILCGVALVAVGIKEFSHPRDTVKEKSTVSPGPSEQPAKTTVNRTHDTSERYYDITPVPPDFGKNSWMAAKKEIARQIEADNQLNNLPAAVEKYLALKANLSHILGKPQDQLPDEETRNNAGKYREVLIQSTRALISAIRNGPGTIEEKEAMLKRMESVEYDPVVGFYIADAISMLLHGRHIYGGIYKTSKGELDIPF